MSSFEKRKSHFTRRDFLKLTGRIGVFGLAAGFGSLSYITRIEPSWLEIIEVPLTLPRLDPVFSGFRMVQISDIHMSRWMTRKRLASVVDLVLEQSADLVAITGDFLIGHGWDVENEGYLNDLVFELRRLSERSLVVAVMGNHDYWTDSFAVRGMLAKAGIIELSNTVFSLKHGLVQIRFCGVDDIWEGHDDLEAVLVQLPADGAAILLAHEPDFADISAATGRFDLQISGHSHGGQVVLPGGGPPITPWLGKKYPSGWYQVGKMQQYTNRGIGMARLGVRFNCRPEITVFTF